MTASSSTAPRPNRWSMTRAGILPLRKPFTVTCWLIFLYAASRLSLSSSKGTSTVSRTRVGFRVSTALFTVRSPWWLTSGGSAASPLRQRPRRGLAPGDTRHTGTHLHSNRQAGRAHNAIIADVARDELLVGVAGFEPTAFRSQSGRATKLRHTPSVRHVGYMPPYAWAAGIRTRPAPVRPATMRCARITGAAGVAQSADIISKLGLCRWLRSVTSLC